MRSQVLIASATVALSVASAAMAADLSAPVFTKAPPVPVAPMFSWTGCYIGGNAGGGWGQHTGDVGVINSGNATLNAGIGVQSSLDTPSSGAIGGGQLGCNYQSGLFVIGLETDIQASGIRGSSSIFFPSPNGGITDATTSTGSERLEWFGTTRARVGFTPMASLFLYGTAGVAYGGVKSAASLVLTPPADGNYSGATSETRLGWTAGAGGEYAFAGNWSVKVEYLYVDLGSNLVQMTDPNRPGTFIDYGFHHRDNIVRAGLNYHFGGPVVARY